MAGCMVVVLTVVLVGSCWVQTHRFAVMTWSRAWLNALENAPRVQVIVGAMGGFAAVSAVLYAGVNAGKKLPHTLSPEWQSLTKEYHKHNNADPIFQK